MSVHVIALTDVPSWAPQDAPRRDLTAAELRDALARREAGQGWQTIAKIHGVNVIDLRAACGDPTLDPSFRRKAAEPVSPRSMKLAHGEGGLAILLTAIEAGARSGGEVFRMTRLDNSRTFALLGKARALDLVDGDGTSGTLRLSADGRAWLEARRG